MRSFVAQGRLSIEGAAPFLVSVAVWVLFPGLETLGFAGGEIFGPLTLLLAGVRSDSRPVLQLEGHRHGSEVDLGVVRSADRDGQCRINFVAAQPYDLLIR